MESLLGKQRAPLYRRSVNKTNWAFVRDAAGDMPTWMGAQLEFWGDSSFFLLTPGSRRDLELELASYSSGGHNLLLSRTQRTIALWAPLLAVTPELGLYTNQVAVWEPHSYCLVVLAQPGKITVRSVLTFFLTTVGKVMRIFYGYRGFCPNSHPEPDLFQVTADRQWVPPWKLWVWKIL